MLKKSQITAFILIGILAVVIIGAIGYFTSMKYGKEEYVPTSMEPIKRYVDSCLQETAESAVLVAGLQGGVIYFSDVIPHEETFYSYSAYWYDAGKDTSVSKEFIANEINTYIEREMENRCIKGFEDFHQVIERGDITSKTEIKEGAVEVEIEYPVTLIEKDTRTMVSKFSAEVPAKMSEAVDIAKDIVQMGINDPDYIHLSEIGDMELTVVPYKYSDDVIIYSITDEDNQVKGMDFKLVFASRFGDESSGNRDPSITNANNLVFIQGKEMKYIFEAFDADNDQLRFDSIGKYKVSEDGTLMINPSKDDIGEHTLTVIVEDGNGGTDYETIRLFIIGAA